jgi:hypothetical protein
MNCIFDSFNKKEATANPFLQPNKNDPGKFTFPTGAALAQAAQAQQAQAPLSGPMFSFENSTAATFGFAGGSNGGLSTPTTELFGFGQPTQTPSFASTYQLFPSLFPMQEPQSFLGVNGVGNLTFADINTTPQKTSVKLTKYTSKITIEKVLALLSSEWYVEDKNITRISQLNPACDVDDITKVAPLAAAAFVDKSVITSLGQLPKIHVRFLQELVQETVKTEDDVWQRVIDLATFYNMYSIIQVINAVRPHKMLTIQRRQITPEIAFVLAVHVFVTNNDRPHDVIVMSKRYSKDVVKLAVDMCMASYGLSWILETQTSEYISKHRNTYILSC